MFFVHILDNVLAWEAVSLQTATNVWGCWHFRYTRRLRIHVWYIYRHLPWKYLRNQLNSCIFMSFSDPTPPKKRLKSYHINKNHQNQPRWMQQTLIIYLRSLATVCILVKHYVLPRSTNSQNVPQPMRWHFLITERTGTLVSLRRWIRRVPEVIWFWLSRSSVWTSAQTQKWRFCIFAGKLREFCWSKLRELFILRIDQWVGQPVDLLTQLLGD